MNVDFLSMIISIFALLFSGLSLLQTKSIEENTDKRHNEGAVFSKEELKTQLSGLPLKINTKAFPEVVQSKNDKYLKVEPNVEKDVFESVNQLKLIIVTNIQQGNLAYGSVKTYEGKLFNLKAGELNEVVTEVRGDKEILDYTLCYAGANGELISEKILLFPDYDNTILKNKLVLPKKMVPTISRTINEHNQVGGLLFFSRTKATVLNKKDFISKENLKPLFYNESEFEIFINNYYESSLEEFKQLEEKVSKYL